MVPIGSKLFNALVQNVWPPGPLFQWSVLELGKVPKRTLIQILGVFETECEWRGPKTSQEQLFSLKQATLEPTARIRIARF